MQRYSNKQPVSLRIYGHKIWSLTFLGMLKNQVLVMDLILVVCLVKSKGSHLNCFMHFI